ncbi:glycogen synthase [Candidatus Dependentiae bacterium]|nr:glycogen synthase [Candidatus Dependentiae bacterium]
MKALLLTNEYPPYIYGGAGVHVEYLSRELAKLIEVEVRCFGDQKFKDKSLSAKGYLYDKTLFRNCPKLLESPLSAVMRCLNFNSENIDADIVHCHTWYTHFGGILAKKNYGIPLVITTHSLEPLRPWKREQLGLGYDFSCWVEKTALEMADAIISVSKETTADILKYFNVKPENIKMIPNGIDTDEYKKTADRNCFSKFGIDPEQPYVLFVGRITRQKGIIHLVNAIKYLMPEIQVVLCAGMPDTPEIGVEMEQAVAEIKKMRKNIVWIMEMVDNKTKIELYSNAAVFCCPSIYEPFGIINLEAMACETPVVASSVGGMKEVVMHNETGLLVELDQLDVAPFEPKVPDKFSKSLAENINKLFVNPELRKKMGMAGRKRVVENYSWTSVAEKIVKLYKSLIL